LQGDYLEWLQMLPSESFDCIVTSPPYWGLRDYGVEGQIGLEPTLDGFVEAIKAGCPPGGHILDPFFGAGTTGLVAERLGRRCTGVELNPAYVALARERLAKARMARLAAESESPLRDRSGCA
jgi:DNA modification methylase